MRSGDLDAVGERVGRKRVGEGRVLGRILVDQGVGDGGRVVGVGDGERELVADLGVAVGAPFAVALGARAIEPGQAGLLEEQQAKIAVSIQALSGLLTIILRTWFTTSVTPAAAARLEDAA